MSEVSKRDAQSKLILKQAKFAKNIDESTTISEVKVHKQQLENAWNRFQELHESVLDRAGATELDEQTNLGDEYHDEYVTACVLFETALDRLQNNVATHMSPLSTPIKSVSPRHLILSRIIINIGQSVPQDIAQIHPAEAPTRLRELNDLYEQYRTSVMAAMQIASEDESIELIASQAEVRDTFLRTVGIVQGLLNNIPQTETELPAAAEIKISALQIEPFDGTTAKWESFRETFEQVIHLRQSMPPVQKLQHLKSCLRGDAAEIVSNFSLTNENYSAAWNLLNKRFDNPYELTRSHLNTLHSLNLCKENAADLLKLLNRTSSTLLALRNLKRPVEHWDDWIVFIVTKKFDAETRKIWEQEHCSGADFPTWNELETFIENRIRTLNAIGSMKTSSQSGHGLTSTRNVRAHAVTEEWKVECPSCSENHAIYLCHPFRQMSVADRRSLVSSKRLCFQCLSSSHLSTNCRSNRLCRFCNQAHNSLLHEENTIEQPITTNNSTQDLSSSENNTTDRPSTTTNSMVGINPSRVMLRSAIIQVRANNGDMHEFRALLDSCSESSFISEYAVQVLKLQKEPADFDMCGIGESSCGRATSSVTAIIKSRLNDFTMPVEALVIRNVSRIRGLPRHENREWSHLAGLALADPDYQHPDRVDLLIGSEKYGWCLLPEIIKSNMNDPVGQNSQFGWLISGPVSSLPNNKSTSVTKNINVNFLSLNSRIDECLERFWICEDVEQHRSKTLDEELCENHFNSTYSRDINGRFHVRIPFRKKQPSLGESLQSAVQRQHQMERKFNKNELFAEEYRKFMLQYEQLGHMKIIGNVSDHINKSELSYYIPHHAVLKESSSSTKLRVVFDASRRSTNGLSLNEQMLPGPRLQHDLSSIVMRWRKHCIVFTADVERMFRQIKIDIPDADYQRIVWRPTTSDVMKIYQLTTVTYGTTSAPYLAVKTIQTLADCEQNRFPIGANILRNDFYVDDVLTGFDDIVSAICGQDQLRQLMSSGGFELKKWSSNCSELLDHLPDGYCECRIPLQLNIDQNVKTLGIQWHPVTDQFSVNFALPLDSKLPTKRTFLSDAARIYDPLGWLAPSIILVKIMFQELWTLKIGWDDPLPSPLASDWLQLRNSFQQLCELRINRWISTTSESTIQLHGYCDASTHAYAAAVYVRTTDANGLCSAMLLCSKTKVAPLKTISLPRLELSGALLLSRLMQNVISSMQFEKCESFYWTDSTIVLAWINGNPARWTVFVANRIAEIQRSSTIRNWNHVSSEDNPADCSSRGVQPNRLASHPLWWTGPAWLVLSSSSWPNTREICDTNEELRTTTSTLHIHSQQSWDLIGKYSNYNHLIKITAYCIRFTKNLRSKNRTFGPLLHDELQAARLYWTKDAQKTNFFSELHCLQQKIPIDRSSSLRSLNPVLQEDGLLHVGGRLVNALLIPEQTRTPIIIPRRCKLAELLIRDAHEHTLHGGPSLMLAKLRRNFWIIDGPNHVRQLVKKCNICFRFNSTLGHQMMGALPAARTTPSRPFAHTAMDYSGAIMLRSSKGRGHHATKGYIAVFVCLSTKAVHIEVVSDLSSSAFIAAYKRFSGRRGVCSDIYSDNATNYVGAAAVFNKTERDLGFNDKVIKTLEMMGTKWHFSPPLAPHFNGLAESAIRSVKHHIRRIIGETTLTFEELTTFLVQVESCLNSRPLYSLSSDPSDFSVLTPGHFLIGAPLNAVPERNLLNTRPSALTRWMLVQQMVQRFWSQWSAEYLHTLQQRKKWQTRQMNFCVGDIVIISDENRPPTSWALGRILEVHPGADGSVRVVTVRTATQTLKRSIVKLARLPTQDDDIQVE